MEIEKERGLDPQGPGCQLGDSDEVAQWHVVAWSHDGHVTWKASTSHAEGVNSNQGSSLCLCCDEEDFGHGWVWLGPDGHLWSMEG